jgi:hypothetical protein
MATAGMVLGLLSIFLGVIAPIPICAIIFSVLGLKSQRMGQAIAGLVLGITVLVIFIILAVTIGIVGALAGK